MTDMEFIREASLALKECERQQEKMLASLREIRELLGIEMEAEGGGEYERRISGI
jgi:hypothetical protein